jgi:hypothetical protein
VAEAKRTTAHEEPAVSESFTAEGWKERAAWLGVSEHAVAGALYDAEAEEEFSKADVEKKVKDFLGREAT